MRNQADQHETFFRQWPFHPETRIQNDRQADYFSATDFNCEIGAGQGVHGGEQGDDLGHEIDRASHIPRETLAPPCQPNHKRSPCPGLARRSPPSSLDWPRTRNRDQSNKSEQGFFNLRILFPEAV